MNDTTPPRPLFHVTNAALASWQKQFPDDDAAGLVEELGYATQMPAEAVLRAFPGMLLKPGFTYWLLEGGRELVLVASTGAVVTVWSVNTEAHARMQGLTPPGPTTVGLGSKKAQRAASERAAAEAALAHLPAVDKLPTTSRELHALRVAALRCKAGLGGVGHNVIDQYVTHVNLELRRLSAVGEGPRPERAHVLRALLHRVLETWTEETPECLELTGEIQRVLAEDAALRERARQGG